MENYNFLRGGNEGLEHYNKKISIALEQYELYKDQFKFKGDNVYLEYPLFAIDNPNNHAMNSTIDKKMYAKLYNLTQKSQKEQNIINLHNIFNPNLKLKSRKKSLLYKLKIIKIVDIAIIVNAKIIKLIEIKISHPLSKQSIDTIYNYYPNINLEEI